MLHSNIFLAPLPLGLSWCCEYLVGTGRNVAPHNNTRMNTPATMRNVSATPKRRNNACTLGPITNVPTPLPAVTRPFTTAMRLLKYLERTIMVGK